MVTSVLPEFAINLTDGRTEPYGSGLINTTWRVFTGSQDYILQRINQQVFRDPQKIADNVRKIGDYLRKNHPDYPFVLPIQTKSRQELAFVEGMGYYRLSPFVKGSTSLDVVENPDEAYEAALQFGRFAARLSELNPSALHITIPDFHNLRLRYDQFRQSLIKGNRERIAASGKAIEDIEAFTFIVSGYDSICNDPAYKIRVMHHDTKISNVLLDRNNKGMCVIDLDTMMPGHFFSDAGDMLRTYLSPVSEEETDLSLNHIRKEIFEAIVKGYLVEMRDELTMAEKRSFIFAGKIMIYMQAIRFLADHFNDDIYYGARYPGHNYYRALNQIDLLKKLQREEPELEKILHQHINTNK
ncbi:phosphotransferase enzyme family protein [Flavihumibacter petaseus]|uniref:phosphotransferase enzyme family protein n=1 Tax=Flavihumibacter petaseus TaxID=549295 RepID=UPI00061D02EF|nr:aminoglycoside phosphotransferase family protein [Flavihumibacter petaseus]